MHYQSKAKTGKCPGCGNSFKSTPYNDKETSAGELMMCHLIGRRECAMEYYDGGRCIAYDGQFLIPETIHVSGWGGVYEVVAVNSKAQKLVLERHLSRPAASRTVAKLKSFGRVNKPKPAWRG